MPEIIDIEFSDGTSLSIDWNQVVKHQQEMEAVVDKLLDEWDWDLVIVGEDES